jgi:hypothetical protein
MLNIIGDFPDHKSVIDSEKLIARWLYNHGKLHMMMKNAIGGNLVRWNATHFGTNYLFLESFLRKKDRFRKGFQISMMFYSGIHILRQEYDALFYDDRISFDQNIEIVNKRMQDVTNDTYMNAGKMN